MARVVNAFNTIVWDAGRGGFCGPEASWSHIMRFLGDKYFVCLCIFMCVGACTHMGCVCRGQRMILLLFRCHLLTLLLRWSLSLARN